MRTILLLLCSTWGSFALNFARAQGKTDTTTLKKVVVTGQRSAIEQKIDMTVVHVNSLISSTGSNALEVLEKLPGVQVDADGNITFKGRSGVLVMIDDKPTYLSASDLATYLRSLPASSLDKIELMTNPPAKYDAAGNAGAINIKMKRSKEAGLNGNLSSSYTQARYGSFTETTGLNYRIKKINLFSNASYGRQHTWRRLDIGRHYFDAAGNLLTVFEQSAHFRPVNNNLNLLLGMDHYLSSNTTWGIVLSGSNNTSRDHREVFSYLSNGMGTMDSFINANNYTKNKFNKKAVNLNYNHHFDSSGRILTFDLDYIRYDANSNESFLNDTYYSNGSLKNSQFTYDSLPSSINIYAAKADYTHPLNGKGKMEAGIKSSYVNTRNVADYFNVANNVSSIDYDHTNNFRYRENINAAYLNFNREFKRFSLQAGLRFENTNGSGQQLGNSQRPDSSFTIHYNSLFPTLFFMYKLDSAGNHSLNFSYGKRISRPYYQDLNPFVFLVDKFTYFSGNPFLRPQFTNNYELAYHYKSTFTLSAVYNNATDIQVETIEKTGNIFISKTANIGERSFYGLRIDVSLKPVKWWTFSMYHELNHNHYQGPLNGGILDESATWVYLSANNQFLFGKGWSAELNGFYLSKRANSQFDVIPIGVLNAGIQKKILKNKATVKCSARDILHTYISGGIITNIPNATATFHNNFNSRQFTVGLSYAFGSQANNGKKSRSSADSESERVKN